MPRTLVVTNDFPPRQGGIETFVYQVARRFPAGEVVVYTSATPGSAEFDAAQPFPVVRDPARTLLPTPRVSARAAELLRAHGCTRVWFGAAAPLGLMAPRLRRAGAERIVATTHGHELWWAKVPIARGLLCRVCDGADTVTYLGEYTRTRIARAVGPRGAARLARLAPGVDHEEFRPRSDGGAVRRELGLGDDPVVVCVARLKPRKGQDTLIRALPAVRRAVPGTRLLVVGSGSYAGRLRALARREGVEDAVVFTGGLPHDRVAPLYAAADVFAMPCRTRRLGLEAEGLGIVFLEAAAAGLPVVVGDSGGAPDAVRDGETGHVVDGGSTEDVAARLTELLLDAEAARGLGEEGRAWVCREWDWDRSYRTLAGLLSHDG
ncbi:glycosyltransferase family 4 protein [Streptomyces somaliensis DSM 40738]|uniref:glycosyltransferase family 4 protein n=1 Tax=Streptomyces somaliensis TaxID=78355 RepID=UPI0021C280AA|nr:glycosyltransferase family 4 protein [Streptomyces somaliensis]MCQ0023681.1 glycosyltransferase family 4 protein [Streptomyces somaliensis DSM 40738]